MANTVADYGCADRHPDSRTHETADQAAPDRMADVHADDASPHPRADEERRDAHAAHTFADRAALDCIEVNEAFEAMTAVVDSLNTTDPERAKAWALSQKLIKVTARTTQASAKATAVSIEGDLDALITKASKEVKASSETSYKSAKAKLDLLKKGGLFVGDKVFNNGNPKAEDIQIGMHKAPEATRKIVVEVHDHDSGAAAVDADKIVKATRENAVLKSSVLSAAVDVAPTEPPLEEFVNAIIHEKLVAKNVLDSSGNKVESETATTSTVAIVLAVCCALAVLIAGVVFGYYKREEKRSADLERRGLVAAASHARESTDRKDAVL